MRIRPWHPSSFFSAASQASRSDRFVNRVGQHAGLTADLGHRLALVQPGLRLRQHLRRELAASSRFGQHKEGGAATRPVLVHRALHRDFGHAKRAANVALRGAATDHQLAGVQAKGRQIVLGVGKDGQMPIEVGHLPVVTLERQIIVQMRGPSREQGQLHLRHRMDLPSTPTPCQPKPAQLNSSRPAKPR